MATASTHSPLIAADNELAMVGSWLLRHDLIDECRQHVGPSDILDDRLQVLAEAIVALVDDHKEPSPSRLMFRLRKERRGDGNVWDWLGGQDYLRAAMHAAGSGSDAIFHSQAVASAALLRRVADAASETREDVETHTDEAGAVAGRAVDRMTAAADSTRSHGAEHVAPIVSRALAELEARMEGRASVGVATGFGQLDALLCGLRPGQLLVLAARPGVGKSALALTMAAHAARAGEGVLFASLEMSSAELSDRLLASQALVSLARLREGRISKAERDEIVRVASECSTWPLHIEERGDVGPRDILASARRIKRRSGLSLVVVDYLQLMRAEISGRGISREQQIADMTRRLKLGARALGVPVLCLAQLNREADASSAPRLSHLRESGAIEQDADVVMFIHRAGDVGTEDDPAVELIVAKQRSGPTGSIPMNWHKQHVTFSEREQSGNKPYNLELP